MDLDSVNRDLSELMQSDNGCQYTDIDDGVITNVSSCDVVFTMLHLNIRSFHRNRDALMMLLADFKDHGVIVHAIGLCETFLSGHSSPMADLENYHGMHSTRNDKVGGGTSLFIHDSVHVKKVIETPFTDTFESISAVVTHCGKEIFISEFYRPPNGNLNCFNENLSLLLNECRRFRTCFLGSDQNLDLLKSNMHHGTCDFMMTMLESDFVPYILKPTRITHKCSSLIDNIHVKSSVLMPNKSYVIVDGMSDHYPCLVMYGLSAKRESGSVILEKRKFTDNSLLHIRHDLLFHDWSNLCSKSVSECYDYLIAVITDCMDKHAPKCLVKIRADEKFREPWLTVKLHKYNQKCRKLCNKTRQTSSETDYRRYKQYRNVLNRVKLHERRTHYTEVFRKIGKNSKLLWNVVNCLVKKSNNKSEIVEILNGNSEITDKTEMVNMFNEHFVSAGEHVQSLINPNPGKRKSDPMTFVRAIDEKFKFLRVTEMQICNMVLKMKSKTSTGIDGIC